MGEPVVEVEGFADGREIVAGTDLATVEVRRSTRRRRSVSAYRDGDRTIVLLPARLSRREERRWVEAMLERLAAQEAKRRPTDAQLHARAVRLADRWLGPGPRPASVTWSTRQGHRFGSCTVEDRTIRVSARLKDAPDYVIDTVLVHELAHLVQPSHNAHFHALTAAHPDHERGNAWLEGFAAGEAAARRSAPVGGFDHDEADDQEGDQELVQVGTVPPPAQPVRRSRPAPQLDLTLFD
ncbi:MAG TPA: M48 family metallopeptidase [Mycobacteriales bacterium]|nr:M48 family metallopeptidase [Mycobacteriales bacterium]